MSDYLDQGDRAEFIERIEKLEHEVFDINNDSRIDEALGDFHKIDHELSELWKQSNAILEGSNKMGKDVEELKEEIKRINIIYLDPKAKYGYHQFYNRTHGDIRDLREVLRELIKWIRDPEIGTSMEDLYEKRKEWTDNILKKLSGG